MEPTQGSNGEAVAFAHEVARRIDGEFRYPTYEGTVVPKLRANEYAR